MKDLFRDPASQFADGSLGNRIADCVSDYLQYLVVQGAVASICPLQNVRKQFFLANRKYFLVVDQDFGEIGEQLLYCHEKIPPDRCNAVRERRGESAAYQKNNAAAKDNIAARLRVRR